MSAELDFTWMRLVLRSLYQEWTTARAIAAIRNREQLAALRAEMDGRLRAAGDAAGIPAGEFGDNLLLALLSLRAKFAEPDGMAKLETNIAMRRRGAGGRSGA